MLEQVLTHEPASLDAGHAAPRADVPVTIARLPSAAQLAVKSIIDRIGALCIILVLLPLLLAIAVVIVMDDPGPVLFAQKRTGLNGVEFNCFKFRTMYVHGAATVNQASRHDPRITRLGRLLRRSSLDELPQLFNVLFGTMSLVGPRPHSPFTKAGSVFFPDAVPFYALRHAVRPGITGWAQVNGYRGETRTVDSLHHRVLHDLYYIENMSLRLDIRILWLTIFRGFFHANAY